MAGSGETMTYGDLDERSSRLARVLHDAGLRRGDVLALLAENTIRYLEVYWAAMRSGLYLVAINRHLAPTEVAHIVSDSDARAMVASAGLRELAEATVPLTRRSPTGTPSAAPSRGTSRTRRRWPGRGSRWPSSPAAPRCCTPRVPRGCPRG